MFLINKNNKKEILIVDFLSDILIHKGFYEIKNIEYETPPKGWEEYFEYPKSPEFLEYRVYDGIESLYYRCSPKIEFFRFKEIVKSKIFDSFNKESRRINEAWPDQEEKTWKYKIAEVEKWSNLAPEEKLEIIKDKNNPNFPCLIWENFYLNENLDENSIIIIDNKVNKIRSNMFQYCKYMSILIAKKNLLIEKLAYVIDLNELLSFDTTLEVSIEEFNRSESI